MVASDQSVEETLVVASVLSLAIGARIGSYICDVFGRTRTLSICNCLSVIDPLLMAVSPTLMAVSPTLSISIIVQVIIGMSKGVATLSICSGLSMIDPLLMAVSSTLSISIIGQVMIGMSIRVAALTVPIYVSEVSPSEIKGRMIVLTEFLVMLTRGK
ncbi:hypothetical protein FCV25MIE_22641 [Fagus crenata]